MRSRLMRVYLACLVGLALNVGVEASSGAEVLGQVQLAGGLPVSGARVLLFDLADLRQGAVGQATTDAAGQFALSVGTGLPTGEPGSPSGGSLVVSLSGDVEMEFVWIPAGTFQMGSPNSEVGRDSDEGPVHEVEISQGFYLAKYEITQGQWEAVMGTRPWAGQSYVQENPSHPAVYKFFQG